MPKASYLLPNFYFFILLWQFAGQVSAQTVKSSKPNWQNLDLHTDSVFGISTEKAYRELLNGKKAVPVIVAVIDGGVDIHHQDLRSVIWKNQKEIPGNQRDDDNNGYVDDVHGWNFLGNVQFENEELVRLVRREGALFAGRDSTKMSKNDLTAYRQFLVHKEELENKLNRARETLERICRLKEDIGVLCKSMGKQNPTREELTGYLPKNEREKQVQTFLVKVLQTLPDLRQYREERVEEQWKYYKTEVDYHLNLQYNADSLRKALLRRYGIGKSYGSPDVTVPDADHGTHVAGIIAAVRNNGIGINGVADHALIMPLPAIPDGDERDEDVAHAIRYAADNGARIINMSFGKGFDPQKKIVDEAVKYAMSKNVLIVHAAGNDSRNSDSIPTFPNRIYDTGRKWEQGEELIKNRADAWIEVGASGVKDDEGLAAYFSNYGHRTVDVFAPGMQINSTQSGSAYGIHEGTSMAAPVVAGLAALIMEYFPQLTARQVKDIILRSVTKVDHPVIILQDGRGTSLPFSDLCVSGGIVNAYEAVKLAEKLKTTAGPDRQNTVTRTINTLNRQGNDSRHNFDPGDWLLGKGNFPATIYKTADSLDLVLSNGLISRRFRIRPFFGCYSYQNRRTGKEMLRSIRPEAQMEIDGKKYAIGGVIGQFEYAYLQYGWLSQFSADTNAFHFTNYSIRDIQPRFPWKPVRWSLEKQWPPKGKEIIFYFEPPKGELSGIKVGVHYELYDQIPLLSKWITVENGSGRVLRINTFKNEILSVVEEDAEVDYSGPMYPPHMLVQSDYAFRDMSAKYADHTTCWLPDSLYTSQVNYALQTPCLLESKPPVGPWFRLPASGTFEPFHTYELLYDSYDKERCGLEERAMYRILAPWSLENPIFLHLTSTDPKEVMTTIDQCAAVGFEMVILSFGSGLNMEDTGKASLNKYKDLVDYAGSKGIELGGYSLFSSQSISDEDDVINPATGKPGGAVFINAPCLGSKWGLGYIQKLKTFITRTGFKLLENDGPYPGDICGSVSHPGHEGVTDSQWQQWSMETSFYRWLRERDVYLNAPDWYFLNGSNKVAMGYRETDWSLPRDRQLIIERQNIYDGTWTKMPAMGWTFVPLTEYHGGGEAATIEPLHEHLEAYEAHLVQNFGSGVQACYRGPRLFDGAATETMVKNEVTWYKKYRVILNSPVLHLRRPDAKDWDGILHANPSGKEKGLAMLYNPLDSLITREISLPLYYTGLTKAARIREKEGVAKEYLLNRDYSVTVKVKIPAHGYTWLLIE